MNTGPLTSISLKKTQSELGFLTLEVPFFWIKIGSTKPFFFGLKLAVQRRFSQGNLRGAQCLRLLRSDAKNKWQSREGVAKFLFFLQHTIYHSTHFKNRWYRGYIYLLKFSNTTALGRDTKSYEILNVKQSYNH